MMKKAFSKGWRLALVLVSVTLAAVAVLWKASRPAPVSGAAAAPLSPPAAAPAQPARRGDADDFLAKNEDLLKKLSSGDQVLSSDEVRKVLEHLRKPPFAESAADPSAEYFNNLIGLLLSQKSPVSELTDVLLAAVDDPGFAPILRDYSLQHLYHAWRGELDLSRKQEIETRLKAHAGDATSPLQGTALLTAARFFENPEVSRGPAGEKLRPLHGTTPSDPFSITRPRFYSMDEFIASALRAAEDPAAAGPARASAFHALLRLEVTGSVHIARRVLGVEATPAETRFAALAVLGAFGSTALDGEMLRAVPVTSELLRCAADHSLRLLQTR